VPTANVSYGTIDSNRTSDLAIRYAEDMLLTPWPFLLASIVLSLVLGLIGYRGAVSGYS
jgi:hypothetical protein